jgi:hypothetical protein
VPASPWTLRRIPAWTAGRLSSCRSLPVYLYPNWQAPVPDQLLRSGGSPWPWSYPGQPQHRFRFWQAVGDNLPDHAQVDAVVSMAQTAAETSTPERSRGDATDSGRASTRRRSRLSSPNTSADSRNSSILAAGSNSSAKSMSLSGLASPRATEPYRDSPRMPAARRPACVTARWQ